MAHFKYIYSIAVAKWTEEKRKKTSSLEILTKFIYWEAERNVNPPRL